MFHRSCGLWPSHTHHPVLALPKGGYEKKSPINITAEVVKATGNFCYLKNKAATGTRWCGENEDGKMAIERGNI